jgi:hypothetical protein
MGKYIWISAPPNRECAFCYTSIDLLNYCVILAPHHLLILLCSPFVSCASLLLVLTTVMSLKIGQDKTQAGSGYFPVVCAPFLMDKAVLSTRIVRVHLHQKQAYQLISRHKWAYIPHQVQTDSLTITGLYFYYYFSPYLFMYMGLDFKLLPAYRAEYSRPQHSPAEPKLWSLVLLRQGDFYSHWSLGKSWRAKVDVCALVTFFEVFLYCAVFCVC